MSSEPPPTYNTPVFNQAYWGIQPELGPLDNRYLQFPTGQGTETIPSLVVANQIKYSYTTLPTFEASSVGFIYRFPLTSATGNITGLSIGLNTPASTSFSVPAGIYIATANFEVIDNQTNQAYHTIIVSGFRLALGTVGNIAGGVVYFQAISCIFSLNTTRTIEWSINLSAATTALGNFKIVRIA